MARIRLEGVTKSYGPVKAVEALTLDIRDREFMVFLGPSGCGKTTTLNIIAGLEQISQGEIWFDENRVTLTPPHQREVAMVFQSYALYPQKTVFENIAFGLRLRGAAREEIDAKVRRAAAELEIAHLLERRPHQLSGGQRQRVALGRALVRQPTAFLMDEPLSNLDAGLRVSMRTLIKKLHRAMGTTFVYVTHDQAEALTLADRITVMRGGVVQQVDTPDAIYNRPRNRFVAGFLGSPQMNFIEGAIADGGGGGAFVRGNLRVALDPAVPAQPGRKVVLGLRAEDVEPGGGGGDSDGGARASTVDVLVVLVSPLGSEQHVNVQVGDVELIVRFPKEARVAVGDRVTLTLDPRRLHLFDAATDESLAGGT
jgi:multiple sugar transport system ATP-binding protein